MIFVHEFLILYQICCCLERIWTYQLSSCAHVACLMYADGVKLARMHSIWRKSHRIHCLRIYQAQSPCILPHPSHGGMTANEVQWWDEYFGFAGMHPHSVDAVMRRSALPAQCGECGLCSLVYLIRESIPQYTGHRLRGMWPEFSRNPICAIVH